MNIKKKLITHKLYRDALEKQLQSPSILIALTGMCNFNCTYCSTKKNKKKMCNIELDLLDKLLFDCKQWNIQPVFGQTYEPFLHPKIDKIINLVNGYGFMFSSATNGSCLTKKVHPLPMNLTISLSENKKEYQYRGSGLDFDTYKETLKSFVRYRVDHNIPGNIQFQIADYTSLESNDITYDKKIKTITGIEQKIRRFCSFLDLQFSHENKNLQTSIETRKEINAYIKNKCKISFITTKIMPNSYDAFLDLELMDKTHKGYCDSCFCIMSIQSDGGIAYCCCDPSANTVFHHIKPDEHLQEIWYGETISKIREQFLQEELVNNFCKKCLYPVSENIKPLLTCRNKKVVSKILNEMGIRENLPWFEFDN